MQPTGVANTISAREGGCFFLLDRAKCNPRRSRHKYCSKRANFGKVLNYLTTIVRSLQSSHRECSGLAPRPGRGSHSNRLGVNFHDWAAAPGSPVMPTAPQCNMFAEVPTIAASAHRRGRIPSFAATDSHFLRSASFMHKHSLYVLWQLGARTSFPRPPHGKEPPVFAGGERWHAGFLFSALL